MGSKGRFFEMLNQYCKCVLGLCMLFGSFFSPSIATAQIVYGDFIATSAGVTCTPAATRTCSVSTEKLDGAQFIEIENISCRLLTAKKLQRIEVFVKSQENAILPFYLPFGDSISVHESSTDYLQYTVNQSVRLKAKKGDTIAVRAIYSEDYTLIPFIYCALAGRLSDK